MDKHNAVEQKLQQKAAQKAAEEETKAKMAQMRQRDIESTINRG